MNRGHGVDLSRWDISFDPAKATGRIDFAIQKASEATFRDAKFSEIWAGAQKVPIRGAYHYLRSDYDWLKQANFFLSVVGGYEFHFFACDFEGFNNVFDAKFADATRRWMEYVAARTGKKVLLYTNPSHYDASLYPYGNWMKDWPLWLAQYWSEPSPDKKPGLPKKRKAGDWKIWQYASEINFAGHANEYGCGAHSVDLNVFNGTVADMAAWAGASDLPAPVPPSVSKTVKILAWPWLRARSGPGTTYSYKIMGALLYGKTVEVVEVKDVGKDRWAKLVDGNWIALIYGGQRLAEFVRAR